MDDATREWLIDARVMRRLPRDARYVNAENAEQQALAEAAITREVERELDHEQVEGFEAELELDELAGLESDRPADDDRAGGRNTLTRRASGDLCRSPLAERLVREANL